MTGRVGLHDLVGSVASAIIDAQGMVERAYIGLVRRRFDADGRPLCLDIKLPRPAGSVPDHDQLSVPLLSLVESRLLAIESLRVDLDVDLGGLDEPTDISAAPGRRVAGEDPVGAPIDTPYMASIDGPMIDPAAAPMAARVPMAVTTPPSPSLAVGIGGRVEDNGPKARLSIKVRASPPSDSLLRLITQLNKLTTPSTPASLTPNHKPQEISDADQHG